MKKKGLSNLIATVLIVLLALAAVAIVWGFIKPAIQGAGPAIDLGTKCFSVELNPVTCVHDLSDGEAKVGVELMQGEDVKEVIVAVELTDGTVETNQTTPPGFLATKTYIVPIAGSGNATLAKAAAVVGDDEGHEEICTVSVTTKDCSVVE